MHALRSPLIWPQGKWSFSFFIYSLATRRCGSNSKSVVSEQTFRIHDDFIKWKHFPCYWPFVQGIHWSPVNSPHKGEWRKALMFSLMCAWMNSWVNNGEAGDLRCHCTHYDILQHVPDSVHGNLWNCSQVNATEHLWWLVNIGSGNGLMPSGNKPLPELMFTQIYVTIYRYMAIMS